MASCPSGATEADEVDGAGRGDGALEPRPLDLPLPFPFDDLEGEGELLAGFMVVLGEFFTKTRLKLCDIITRDCSKPGLIS